MGEKKKEEKKEEKSSTSFWAELGDKVREKINCCLE